MLTIIQIILYSFISGAAILIGAFIAKFLNITDKHKKVIHGVTAFGGGVLIAAVAFALTPKAIEVLSTPILVMIFVTGTIFFAVIDIYITSKAGSFAQVMAMLMDYLPEALALGAAFAHNIKFGILLAFFIGIQNLPEGFNSYEELMKGGLSSIKSLLVLLPLCFLGVIAAILGFIFLSEKTNTIAAIMLFASGGIIYVMFQQIAPLSKMKNSWIPAFGASLGFLLGMIGEKLLI